MSCCEELQKLKLKLQKFALGIFKFLEVKQFSAGEGLKEIRAYMGREGVGTKVCFIFNLFLFY